METLPNCPKCDCEYTYENMQMLVCPECAHEWAKDSALEDNNAEATFKDANGTILSDGDSVSLIKDLKLKGASSVIKAGTKVKNIRLVDGDHNISCKVDGVGATMLKSEFVKKV